MKRSFEFITIMIMFVGGLIGIPATASATTCVAHSFTRVAGSPVQDDGVLFARIATNGTIVYDGAIAPNKYLKSVITMTSGAVTTITTNVLTSTSTVVAKVVVYGLKCGTVSTSGPVPPPFTVPAPPAQPAPPAICADSQSTSDPSAPVQTTPSDTSTDAIQLSSNASQTTAGASIRIFGYVADTRGCAIGNKAVSLMYQGYGQSQSLLQTLVTDSTGAFSRITMPSIGATFQAVSDTATSNLLPIQVARKVVITFPGEGAHVGKPFLLKGRIGSPKPGTRVAFSYYTTSGWQYLGYVYADAYGNWSKALSLPHAAHSVRAYVNAGNGFAFSTAYRRLYEVS